MGRRTDLALSRESIARAALAILDEGGAAAVTLRNIATRLGVRSPSLYNHVTSKDDILDAVTELIGREIDESPLADPDLRRGLTGFARSYRQAFRQHPDALAVIAQRAVETDVALAAYDTAIGRLQREGWHPVAAFETMAALEYIVLGSALVPFTRGFIRSPAEYADRYPALARSLSAAELDAVDDRGFELALDLFLDALIARGPAS
ncbi:TetR/AcrR family transcriptional regulator [Pseudonocardia sp. TRM90224]|uniref:TetR/AcrR family transcriptional regulator n=1 Tax=Pseudonocardia sp. TRM90224 TaxID=2812678 RepID=UPI001E5C4F4C|nr:TetR family transcriptional regulator [Pseudonocardia sp. TRM90224]